MAVRWPLVIFFNTIDVSEINKDWNRGKLSRRRNFLEKLGYELVKPHIERRRCLPRASTAAATVMKDIEIETHTPVFIAAARKRGTCQVCPNRNDSKTSNTCVNCKRSTWWAEGEKILFIFCLCCLHSVKLIFSH